MFYAEYCDFLPLEPPVSLNGITARITPNISWVRSVYTLPVLESGRSSSKIFPLDTTISCALVPEKFPWTAWVTPVARCSVRLYKNMVLPRGG